MKFNIGSISQITTAIYFYFTDRIRYGSRNCTFRKNITSTSMSLIFLINKKCTNKNCYRNWDSNRALTTFSNILSKRIWWNLKKFDSLYRYFVFKLKLTVLYYVLFYSCWISECHMDGKACIILIFCCHLLNNFLNKITLNFKIAYVLP